MLLSIEVLNSVDKLEIGYQFSPENKENESALHFDEDQDNRSKKLVTVSVVSRACPSLSAHIMLYPAGRKFSLEPKSCYFAIG